MKRIYRSLLVGLVSLSFVGCNKNNSTSSFITESSNISVSSSLGESSMNSSNNNSSSVNNEKIIKNIEVNNYEKTLTYLHNFDDSNVNITLTYDDDSEEIITYERLVFDYSNFSSTTLGKQTINVGVYGLDINKDIEVEVIPADSFNILMVGNSFSDDTIEHVYDICKDLGIEVNIANLYIGGCNLDTHYQNLTRNNKAYAYRVYNKNTNSWNWTNVYNTSIEDAINDYDWDFVSLQQVSGLSGIGYTYSKLDMIFEEILYLKEDVNFVWNMTWAYQQNTTHGDFARYEKDQMTMYNKICETVQNNILNNEYVKAIIPNGTSVQNVRTSFIGDTLTRDGYHLSYDLGRYITGLTLVATMTGQDISKIKFAPNGVSETHRQVVVEAVQNALANPFEVTESSYKEAPSIDLSEHIEIDYHPVVSAFYDSTSTKNYNKVTTSSELASKFVASKRFTKEELPIGTILEIKPGYQYRPEGWIGDTVQTSRPSNVSTQFVTIDEAWWGDYTYRAFNISKSPAEVLTSNITEACEAFSIYVPLNNYKEEVNSYAYNDFSLFTTNSLDINNYEVFDYSVSNGYYNSTSDAGKKVVNVGDFATKFICTDLLTKEELPIGTILIIDEGYQYRPDGWINDEAGSKRPSNVTTNFIVIDEAWWGEYTHRGINISKTDGSIVNQEATETSNHFRIYIPK